ELDVDHWSGGELTRLEHELAAARQQLADDAPPLSLDRLQDIVQRQTPEFELRLSRVVETATMRQVASQVRVNLADIVVHTLDGVAGYELIDGSYAGEDQRGAFVAKLRHQNGNEIVVDVSPAADDSGQAVLRLLSYDHDIGAEEDRLHRARAV